MATIKAARCLTPHGAGRCFDRFLVAHPEADDVIEAVRHLTLAGYTVRIVPRNNNLPIISAKVEDHVQAQRPRSCSSTAFSVAHIVCLPARAC